MSDKPINWLASYPKSGNTWVRLLIDAYVLDREPNINTISSTMSDFSPRMFDAGLGVDVEDLPYDRQLLIRPTALLRVAMKYEGWRGGVDKNLPLILKAHAANIMVHDVRLIPPQLTQSVVLIIRDPRDVALSYARHSEESIETIIDVMLSDDARIGGEGKLIASYTMSWRDHLRSYITDSRINVAVVRYEDLQANTLKAFTAILKHFGIEADEERAQRAVENCELSKMKSQEAKKGFKESLNGATFFGGGNGETLPVELALKLEAHAGEYMQKFGYQLTEMKKAC